MDNERDIFDVEPVRGAGNPLDEGDRRSGRRPVRSLSDLRDRFDAWQDGLSRGQLSNLAKILAAVSLLIAGYNIWKLFS